MTLKIRNLKQRSNSLINEHDVTTATKVFATFQTVKICPLMKARVTSSTLKQGIMHINQNAKM